MSRWSSRPGTATSWTSTDPPPRAAIARCPAASSPASSPRFQATRIPPGASSGKASSTSSASEATARAVTAAQRPRWRPSRARASARTAAASTVSASPMALAATDRKARLLGHRLEEQRSRRGQRDRERDPRVAAAGPEVDEPVDAPVAEDAHRAEAVDDVRERHRPWLADRGQVDGRGPGQQQAGVAVDRGARRRVERQSECRGARLRARRRTPVGAVGCPRRASGAAHAVGPRHASCGSRAIPPRGAAPGVGIVSHCWLRVGLPRSIRFAAGSPRAPRGPRYPGACPSADAGR